MKASRVVLRGVRGEIELQCSVTGKKLAGYNRFDHIHIECKQPVLSKIGNYNPLSFLLPGGEFDVSMDRNYPIANKTTITQ